MYMYMYIHIKYVWCGAYQWKYHYGRDGSQWAIHTYFSVSLNWTISSSTSRLSSLLGEEWWSTTLCNSVTCIHCTTHNTQRHVLQELTILIIQLDHELFTQQRDKLTSQSAVAHSQQWSGQHLQKVRYTFSSYIRSMQIPKWTFELNSNSQLKHWSQAISSIDFCIYY